MATEIANRRRNFWGAGEFERPSTNFPEDAPNPAVGALRDHRRGPWKRVPVVFKGPFAPGSCGRGGCSTAVSTGAFVRASLVNARTQQRKRRLTLSNGGW
jgi:hypothetical protein